jgi:hypothetical protein
MKPQRRGGAEGPVEEDLAGGGGEQVGSPHDFGDSKEGIVHHHREFIGWDVITVPNEKIPKVDAGVFFHRPEISIRKRNGFAIRHTETPVQTCG